MKEEIDIPKIKNIGEDDDDQVINVGQDTPVVLCKLFGPTGFASIRITARLAHGERGWVIERKQYVTGKDGDESRWIHLMTIPNQIPSDYPPDEAT